MEFHEKLQELRKNRGLTQEELAEALYVSRTAISKWESGRGYPSIDSLKEISNYLVIVFDEYEHVFSWKSEKDRKNLYADIKMSFEEKVVPKVVKLRFYFPMGDCYSVWSPNVRYDRSLKPNWLKNKSVSAFVLPP